SDEPLRDGVERRARLREQRVVVERARNQRYGARERAGPVRVRRAVEKRRRERTALLEGERVVRFAGVLAAGVERGPFVAQDPLYVVRRRDQRLAELLVARKEHELCEHAKEPRVI